MTLIDILIIAIVVVILGAAVWYIHREKKKGTKCIGCPSGGTCSGGCPGCNANVTKKE